MSTVFPTPSVKELVASVQNTQATGASVSSLAVTLPKGAPRVGSVLVALLALNSATVTVTSITQTGVTWSQWMSKSGTGVEALAWLGIVTSASAPASFTVNLSAAADLSVDVTEWSGLNTQALTLATGAGNSGTGQTADSGPATIAPVATANGTLTPKGLWITGVAAATASTTALNGPGLNQFSAPKGGGTANVELGASWIDEAPPAPTYEYYVSPSGNDTNPGTQALPFFSLGGAYAVIQGLDLTNTSGVLVHFAAGYHVWPGHDFGSVNRTTSATAPIRYVADKPGGTFILAAEGMSDHGTAYSVFDGFTVLYGAYNIARGFFSQQFISIGGDYSVIQNCAFPNHNGLAPIQSSGNYNVIRRNSLLNYVGPTASTSGYIGIQVYGNYAQVVDNLLVGVLAIGILLYNNNVTGIGQHIVTNNTICNVIPLSGVTSQYGLTVPMSAGIVIGCQSGTSDYSVVANNIIRDVNVGIKEFITAPGVMGTHNVYQNNDVFNAATAAYQFLTGAQTGGIASDPLFVNYQTDGSGDYHLTSSSPCKDAGVSGGAPDQDFDGFVRPAGAAYDIGAYEYASSAASTHRGVWSFGAASVNWAAIIGVLTPLVVAPSSGFNGYYRAVTREAGAVAYFRMNEPSGALSIVDNALPGTYQGALSSTGVTLGYGGMLASDPATAGAALFDGAAGVVTTTYTPGALSAFSLRAWLAWDGWAAVGAHPRIVATDTVTSDHAGFELYITPNSGSPTISAALSNGSTDVTLTSAAQVPYVFTRTQVFLTYDGATARLYINGALVASGALTGSVAAALHALHIGADASGASNFFAGLIQDVAVFPTALSAAQVTLDYLAGVRGPAQQQSAASQYGFKQQLVMVYSASGAFIDVWRDAPLLAGVKYALNSATTPLRVQLPRKFDDFDESGAPGALGSIAQGNIVQYFIFGPGLPTGGVLKYQGTIDAYAPQITESGEESVTVTLTPFDSVVGDHGLLGDVTFGVPNSTASYVDPVTIFNYWFSSDDADTNQTFTYPLTLDPNNPTSSGVTVQYTFTTQALSSVFDTVTKMLPANWYWRVNGDRTVTLNVPPVTAQHLFIVGKHIVAPTYKKDWTRLKNVINVVGTGLSVALTAGLTSGVAVSTLSVDPLPIDVVDGQSVIINDGGNPTFTFSVRGNQSAGATTLNVNSGTPNFSYPAGTSAALIVSATAYGSDLATFGKRVMQLADNRVTDVATAQTLADGLLTQYDQMILRTKIRVVDYRGDANWGIGYDIESIEPGDTCQIVNPSNKGNALSQVAIIFGLTYGFDYVDLELGYFIPEDSRDLVNLRSAYQDFTLGR